MDALAAQGGRTIIIPTLNACGAQKVNFYGTCSGVSCYVLQNVQQQNHTKINLNITSPRPHFSVQQRYLNDDEKWLEAGRAFSQVRWLALTLALRSLLAWVEWVALL